MEIRNNIPNAITACNLLSGCIGILLLFDPPASPSGPLLASFAILAAAFFDLMDGLVARAIGASSDIGGQLDSLADLVSFGVLPSLICYYYLGESVGGIRLTPTIGVQLPPWSVLYPLLAFFIAVFAAVRLARFNLDSEQTKEFKGMPVPANALFWAGIPLAISGPEWGLFAFEDDAFSFLVSPPFLLSMVLVLSFLMVSPLRCISFKFQRFGWKGNEGRYFTIGASVLLFLLFFFKAMPFIVLLYPVLSMIFQSKAS